MRWNSGHGSAAWDTWGCYGALVIRFGVSGSGGGLGVGWGFANVFVPEGRVGGDEGLHEGDAVLVGEVEDVNAGVAEPGEGSGEVLGFADEDGAEAELADEAGAVPAGGECGDEDEVAVGGLAAGSAEGVGFAVDGGVVLLDAAVSAGGEKVSFGGEDGGADGDAAFAEAEAGFGKGGGEEGEGVEVRWKHGDRIEGVGLSGVVVGLWVAV